MKFRLTVLLLAANLLVLFFIWSLERTRGAVQHSQARSMAFTALEISGKNIDKPRVLKFADNRWRIVSPIDWKANLFAVNRIKTQLEFLDRKTSFSKAEALNSGHTLAEYGLDAPSYVLRYGNGEKMDSIKIGKNTSVGDRFYLLDEAADTIVVVDREFVEGLVQDMERLRDQSVFTMPSFEVASFSVRLPLSKSEADEKGDFKHIGLQKEAGAWKFETPIVADADNAEVDAFLNEICKIPALNFNLDKSEKTGFELASLPTTITLNGTNRREVLMLGARSKDGRYVYARLEDNPTIFAVDASVLSRLEGMQTTLREKAILRCAPSRVTGIDISENGSVLKLRKLTSGSWEVVATAPDGKVLTLPANLGLVNKLLLRLECVRAAQFVDDAAGGNLAKYGIDKNSLKISLLGDGKQVSEISIGSFYRTGGVNLRYANIGGTPAVYGISRAISDIANTEILFYRSPLVCSLANDDVLQELKIVNLLTGKTEFELSLKGTALDKAVAKMPMRRAAAAKALAAFARDSVADSFSQRKFDESGIDVGGGKIEKWNYALSAVYSRKGAAAQNTRVWRFSKRLGATIQYCNVSGDSSLFFPQVPLINSLFELTQENSEPAQLQMPTPTAPSKL